MSVAADDVENAKRHGRRSADPERLPDFRERIDGAVDLAGGTMPIGVVVEDGEIDAAIAHLARHGRRAKPVEIQTRSFHLEETARRPLAGDA